MNDDSPATRGELKAMGAELRQAIDHVVETLGARMDRMRGELSTDFDGRMVRMREDLSRELAGHVRAAAEENRQFLAVLDDRYRDLPPRVTLLERELDEHRRDPTLHPRRRRK